MENWLSSNRIKQTVKKIVPINTWNPWKPVAIKKVDPKIPSDIEKLAETYSKACNAVKNAAKIIVKTKPKTASILLPAVIAWWAYVTVAPEHNNNSVLSNGTSIGSKGSIPFGGQIEPISIIGAKAAAKKAQKKAKKNIISETIKSSTP